VQELKQLIEQREGKTLTVDTPRERLETLFLRIVEEAHAARLETSGTAPVGEIAGFLGEEEAGRAVLESLVRTEPVEAKAPPEPAPPRRGEVDRDVLSDLTQAAPPSAKEEEAAAAASEESPASSAPPVGDVDRSVLDDLTAESQHEDKDAG